MLQPVVPILMSNLIRMWSEQLSFSPHVHPLTFRASMLLHSVKSSVCVCLWCPSLRCGFASRSVREVWLCLCMIHMKQTSWDAPDALSCLRDATRTSPSKPPTPTDTSRRGSTECSEVFATKLLCCFPFSFKGLNFWYKFYEHCCCL